MSQRRLRSGEPANFQGDERDVIIISTVIGVNPAIPSSRVAGMTGIAAMRRINVAASRARQQMWIVHSVEPGRFPDGDLRGALIRHCRTLAHHRTSRQHARCLRVAIRAGRAAEDPRTRLPQSVRPAPRQPVPHRHRRRRPAHAARRRMRRGPLARPRRLAQRPLPATSPGTRGWTFERIRGSAFYLDPDTALLPLWQRLPDLDIPTGDWWSAQTPQPVLREIAGQSGRLKRTSKPQTRYSQPAHLVPGRHRTPRPRPRPQPVPALPDHSPGHWSPRRLALPPPAVAVSTADPENPSGGNDDPNDAEPGELSGSSERALRLITRPGDSLLPYQAWTPRTLPHPDLAPLPVIIAGLQEIVGAEGPIHAERAYRLYTRAAGGHRVGPTIRRTFHKATRQALRKGELRQIDDGISALDQKTLYLPGKPSTLVRDLGSRQLWDVPRSEIAKLIKYLSRQGAADNMVKRAVLDAYGLVRLSREKEPVSGRMPKLQLAPRSDDVSILPCARPQPYGIRGVGRESR